MQLYFNTCSILIHCNAFRNGRFRIVNLLSDQVLSNGSLVRQQGLMFSSRVIKYREMSTFSLEQLQHCNMRINNMNLKRGSINSTRGLRCNFISCTYHGNYGTNGANLFRRQSYRGQITSAIISDRGRVISIIGERSVGHCTINRQRLRNNNGLVLVLLRTARIKINNSCVISR